MTSHKRIGSFPTFSSRLAGLITLAIVGCGMSGLAAAREPARRGDVITKGPAAKAVALGPVELHAYSEFSGGSLYTVRAVTGTDSDCRVSVAPSAATVPADRITNFAAKQGEVVCLATTTKGSFELLWHAGVQPVAAPMVLAKAKR